MMTSFLCRPRNAYAKTAKRCINSTCIAFFIHGFVPVKTWLLIACDIAFNAIIYVVVFFIANDKESLILIG